MGAIAGSLTAAVIAADRSQWTPDAVLAVEAAESMLAGSPVPVELAPRHAVPVAVGLAASSAPLLVDGTTVALIDAVRDGLFGGGRPDHADPLLAKAAGIARSHPFPEAVNAAGGDAELVTLVGAFVGLEGGLGAVPARLVSTLTAPDGRRGRRYLCALTNRLLGVDRPNWYDPRRRRGPKEVLPGLWLSNLYGVGRFVGDNPDGLVLSLCDDEGQVAGHEHHITFHLEDTPRTDANPSLGLVVDEILDEISAARSADRPVLVHCRHGASRTGMILRLLLVAEHSLTADEALTEALCHWPHTSTWNGDWTSEVERRASAGSDSVDA